MAENSPNSVKPPATKTFPLSSSVAVWDERGRAIRPVVEKNLDATTEMFAVSDWVGSKTLVGLRW